MKAKILGTLLIITGLVSSCTNRVEVDTVVYNARIYTLDSVNSVQEAMAIKDGRIIATGSNDLKDRFSASEVIDLEAQTVVPGLIDAHSHFYGLGLGTLHVNLVGTGSIEQVRERITAFDKEGAPVVYGRGWDQNDWNQKKFPTRHDLDLLISDRPVILERVDGHAYWVNSKALELAGISADTPSDGGAILLENGAPSGILVDGPMRYIDSIIPAPSREQQIRALLAAQQICFENGLTTVSDAGISRSVIDLIDSLQQAGAMKIRIYAMVSNTPDDVDYFLNRGVYKTEKLNVRSIKVYGDGALGSRGAALKRPYADAPGHFGAFVTPISEMQKLADRIIATEFQMNTHAIGDSANVAVLQIYDKLLHNDSDRRWRIEHAQIVDPIDRSLFEKGVIPSVQPTHATSDMYWAEERLGSRRMKGAYAYQSLLAQSGMIALGTDFPVESVDPISTFYAAVSRKDASGYPEGGFFKEEALSREQALRGMTHWAAYAQFEDHEKGRLLPGYLADFTILSDDLMQAEERNLTQIKATAVFVSGNRVF